MRYRAGRRAGMGLLLLSLAGVRGVAGEPPADEPPLPRFHLVARPWSESGLRADGILDAVEAGCRFLAGLQDAHGAVIDPLLHREHQYGTPYFAASVAMLAAAGRAPDLLEAGCQAMDHATEAFAAGAERVPDRHGEFFLASLPEALAAYEEAAQARFRPGRGPAPERLALWRGRLATAAGRIVNPVNTNNWRTYAMKGEWRRALLGLVGRDAATAFVEGAWAGSQRDRIAADPWNLYQDRGTDPDSLAVEAVGRDNLLALAAAGYDGPSGPEIAACAERGTRTTLLLQDPSGQCPPGGRASDHVFNDALYVLAFEVLAEREAARGDGEAAGRCRRAAALAFRSLERWRRTGGEAAGSWFVTKNRFDPALRVGYQAASNVANYNAATVLHLAEAARAWRTGAPERPAPAEAGGYAFATGPGFAAAVADAGGMQLFAALRGDTKEVYGRYWTALGVDRFARAGWETRLGPSDGIRDAASGRGATFAPTWMEGGKWVRLADLPDRYAGRFHAEFVHPLLVRCGIDYAPLSGAGPRFRHEFVITPDGVLATLRADVPAGTRWGATWPLLEDDGAPLETEAGPGLATTGYPGGADREAFLDADANAPCPEAEEPLQSAYGWLRPLRSEARDGTQRTFVYPCGAGDPAPGEVRRSLRIAGDGFSSALGRVVGNLYVGRTAAGGEGASINWDGDGKAGAVFSETCRFVVRLDAGKAVAVEADRPVRATIGGRTVDLAAYVPVTLAP